MLGHPVGAITVTTGTGWFVAQHPVAAILNIAEHDCTLWRSGQTIATTAIAAATAADCELLGYASVRATAVPGTGYHLVIARAGSDGGGDGSCLTSGINVVSVDINVPTGDGIRTGRTATNPDGG